jgi:outer membrane lipoprotein-sorting protein
MTRLRPLILAAFCVAAPFAPAAVSAQPAQLAAVRPVELTGAARTDVLNKASAALQNLKQIQGAFVQINPNGGVSKGKFYLRRPGKIRFEYDKPDALLVVADGSVVAIQDDRLKTFNRAPLRSTPLYFFLKDKIDLAKDAVVTKVERQNGMLAISLKDRSGQSDGVLTLFLEEGSYSLQQWVVADGAGGITRVALNGVQRVSELDPKLFVLQPKTRPLNR